MSHNLGGLKTKKQPVPRMSISLNGFGSPINGSYSIESSLSQVSVKSFSKISNSLLSPTGSAINRRKSFGIILDSKENDLKLPCNFDFEPGKNNLHTPQFMHGTSSTRGRRASCVSVERGNDKEVSDANSRLSKSQLKSIIYDEDALNISNRLFEAGVQSAPLKELNEDPRYGIWHPRYRMPNGIFGFSKPFIHSPDIKKRYSKRKFSV